MSGLKLVHPEWPAAAAVSAFSTTRLGGFSEGPWQSLNLGQHCGDDPGAVRANLTRLEEQLPFAPLWMRQVHGIHVLDDDDGPEVQEADARVTSRRGMVLAVLTADCLPVLLSDRQGEVVGLAHAGWRGLAGGVIQATVARMGIQASRLLAWLGPAISGPAYQVGDEVRSAFAASPAASHSRLLAAFTPDGARWRFDLYAAAREILTSLGVEAIYGGEFCTFTDSARFFSYRRDGVTGRMASLIWLNR